MTREVLKLTKPFEIFMPGTFHGTTYGYGNDFPITNRLDNVFSNFEVGRPRMNLIRGHNVYGVENPALGWTLALSKKGAKGIMLATARNVDMELVDDVKNERFPMRSVEAWSNWKGKGLAFSGIAFLGSNPPEVDSLADVPFSADPSRPAVPSRNNGRILFTFECSEPLEEDVGKKFFFAPSGTVSFAGASRTDVTVVSRTELVRHMGATPDDLVPDEETLQELQQFSSLSSTITGEGGEVEMDEKAIKALIDAQVAAHMQPFSAKITTLETDNATLKEENVQLKQNLSATQAQAATVVVQAKVNECKTFAKGLLDQKRITPAIFEGGLAAFMSSLDDQKKFKFAGDKEATQLEQFKALLSALPPVGATLDRKSVV